MRLPFLAAAALTVGLATLGLVGGVGSAGAQEACQGNFDAYNDPLGSVTCQCDAASPNGTVYGSGTYTSDSDLCTAARHAGVIKSGGPITAQGAPGCQAYNGTTQNGVTSSSWAAWDRSVFFPIAGDGSCASGAADSQQPAQQPPVGDALAIFLAMTQAAPPGLFTYQDAKSLSPTSFEITGIVLTPEGPESVLPIAKLTMDEIDMASLMQGGTPKVMKMRVEGLALNSTNFDVDADLWEVLGTQSLLANINLDFASDEAARTFTLNDLTLDLPGYGRLGAKLDLSGVGADAMMAPEMAAMSALLHSASVSFDDQTLVGRALAAAVKESGMSEQDLLAQALQELSNGVAEAGGQPGDRIYQAAQMLGGLLLDAGSPKGPLTFSLAPATPVTFADMQALEGPTQAAELLNFTSSYAGSQATLPEAQAVAPAPDEQGGAYAFTDKDSYAAGETVTVYWSGLPGNPQDWVTVVPRSAPDDTWGEWWTYTQGQTEGSAQVSGLAPGEYEVRVYYNWPDGGFAIQAAYLFTVTP